jgi:hypothetical protein
MGYSRWRPRLPADRGQKRIYFGEVVLGDIIIKSFVRAFSISTNALSGAVVTALGSLRDISLLLLVSLCSSAVMGRHNRGL